MDKKLQEFLQERQRELFLLMALEFTYDAYIDLMVRLKVSGDDLYFVTLKELEDVP